MFHRVPLVAFAGLMLSAAVSAQAPAPAPTRPVIQPIPRALFLTNMDASFAGMDANKDGVVSSKEASDFQRAQILAANQARNRALFAQLDADRNGVLSPAEFARVVPPAPAQVNLTPMFQRFDTNHDSSISKVEYRAATVANFDRLDTDKDGIVSAAEMRAGGIAK